ncbi:MAG TPA: RNA polymerase factor sigma-54 [Rickettsiales bacterium]|nr:RNA polymerase factor sigma-54 [Rickettsiales bacterium]
MSAIVPRLELRQGQTLTMTQQLQQSIKLLQMSSLEITEYVEQEIEKNPLLSGEDEEGEKPEGQEEAEVLETAGQENEQLAAQEEEPAAAYEDESSVYENPYEGEQYEPRIKTQDHNYEEGEGFESYTASEKSLREFLLEQLNLEATDPVMRMIGQHLIDLVDESGYIKDDLANIAALLSCPPELIEETLRVLQGFEPIGVCARNLAECLSIQLRDKNRLDPAMEKLLAHLDLVAKKDIKQLSKICGVDEDDIREMSAEVRALNPRPGSGFQHEAVQAIIPDVFLRRAGDNWNIELNAASLPRVLVNRRYYAQVSGKASDKQEKKYLSEQFAAANWLVRALDSRAQTILKVATEIVKQQENFFLYGIKYLKPLTLKEVADAVELHESTVSRVTTNKFILTARGTFEFKYFFNASIQGSDGGESYSNKTVQYMIKELIDKEGADSVLSDDTIAERLRENGIELARRTVAKYRELMKIPSSSVRKRQLRGGEK